MAARPSKLTEFEALCQRQGLPVTAQRRAVLQALAAREDHPTADQIHHDVQADLPDISRTTVYRVLDTLVRLGIVGKVSHMGSSVRFDACTERHHHLVCVSCGRLNDLVLPALDALPKPDTRRQGFEILDYSVHFRGRCAACRRLPTDSRRLPGGRPRRRLHVASPDRAGAPTPGGKRTARCGRKPG